MRHGKIFVVLIFAFVLSSFALAQPTFTTREVAKAVASPTVTIPENAVEVTPGVFQLPSVVVNGRVVQGFMFVDYKKEFAKPPWAGGGGATSNCFSFLAKGAKWKMIENYLVDPTNNTGLNATFVRSNVALDISKWEDAADGAVGNGISKNILGNEVSGAVDGADTSSPDNKNEVLFANVDSPGAIAVTIVWGYFSGPPSTRELIEWDQVYDDADFAWSSSGEAGKIDFENIATHELGHAVGMGHSPDTCTEETMYRFADYGETKKRDLNAGDVAGVKSLYK